MRGLSVSLGAAKVAVWIAYVIKLKITKFLTNGPTMDCHGLYCELGTALLFPLSICLLHLLSRIIYAREWSHLRLIVSSYFVP